MMGVLVFECVFGGQNDGRNKFVLFIDYYDLFYEEVFFEFIFDWCWCYVFVIGGFEQFFFVVGDFQEWFVVWIRYQGIYIVGMELMFFVNIFKDFGGCFGFVVIVYYYIWLFCQDFVFVGVVGVFGVVNV